MEFTQSRMFSKRFQIRLVRVAKVEKSKDVGDSFVVIHRLILQVIRKSPTRFLRTLDRRSRVFTACGQSDEVRHTLISSISHMANFAQSDALGQMQSDSDKTYGIDRSDFVRHQR